MYPKVNTAVSASNVRLAPRPRRNIHQAINYFFPKISKFPMRISQVKNQSRQTVLSQAGEGLRSPYQKPRTKSQPEVVTLDEQGHLILSKK